LALRIRARDVPLIRDRACFRGVQPRFTAIPISTENGCSDIPVSPEQIAGPARGAISMPENTPENRRQARAVLGAAGDMIR
jgi:hypothetical protein